MIVDDEEFICETIKDYFEDIGWSVMTFFCGRDALNFLEDNNPEYIIVDGRLPDMPGTAFIIEACSLKSGIKYIIYTGSFDFTVDDDLRNAGISEKNIVIKPVMSLSKLQSALEQLNGD
jgi:DNA-binding NtrC family response regulator